MDARCVSVGSALLRMGWFIAAVVALILPAGCAGSSGGDDVSTSTGGPDPVSSEVAEGAVTTETVVSWIEAFAEAVADDDPDAGASMWSDLWDGIGIPMASGDAAIRPPATPQDGVEFLSGWAHVAYQECDGEADGFFVEVKCTGTVTGPFPDALGLAPFELPFRVVAVADGLISIETDFDAIQGTSGTWPEEGAFVTYEAFYQYALGVDGFATEYQAGTGQPLPTVDAAQAHVELATAWTASGQP